MFIVKLNHDQMVTLMMCVEGRIDRCKDREHAEDDRPEHWRKEAEKAQALYELLDELPASQ